MRPLPNSSALWEGEGMAPGGLCFGTVHSELLTPESFGLEMG